MVYLWEQNDRGPRQHHRHRPGQPRQAQRSAVPGVRHLRRRDAAGTLLIHSPGENIADGNPSRTFPDIDQILANNTNADTGACPAAPASAGHRWGANVPVADASSATRSGCPTPTTSARLVANNTEPSLNFRLTARDMDPAAGGYAFGDTKVLIDATAGPFLVQLEEHRTPAAGVAGRTRADLLGGGDTNGYTDGARRDCAATNVKISLSTDGGQHLPLRPGREHAQRRQRRTSPGRTSRPTTPG